MVIKFDSSTLQMVIMVGPEETYRPSKKIKNIYNRVEDVKKELTNFINSNWEKQSQEEIVKLLKNDEKEKAKFDKFLNDKHIPLLQGIVDDIKKVNELKKK